jgi:type IV secretory pathway TrbF-like protein
MVMRWRFSDAIWLSAANVAYEACWQLNRTSQVYVFVFIGALPLALPNPAFANWWIVRASDKQCLVVDIEPTGKDKSVTKIGEKVYPTREEAEADVKRLCKQ